MALYTKILICAIAFGTFFVFSNGSCIIAVVNQEEGSPEYNGRYTIFLDIEEESSCSGGAIYEQFEPANGYFIFSKNGYFIIDKSQCAGEGIARMDTSSTTNPVGTYEIRTKDGPWGQGHSLNVQCENIAETPFPTLMVALLTTLTPVVVVVIGIIAVKLKKRHPPIPVPNPAPAPTPDA